MKLVLLKLCTQINVISKAWKFSGGSEMKQAKVQKHTVKIVQVDFMSLGKWNPQIKRPESEHYVKN